MHVVGVTQPSGGGSERGQGLGRLGALGLTVPAPSAQQDGGAVVHHLRPRAAEMQ